MNRGAGLPTKVCLELSFEDERTITHWSQEKQTYWLGKKLKREACCHYKADRVDAGAGDDDPT